MTIRVLIVDDHALVRAGMRMILSAEIDIEVIGDAESGEVALPLIRSLKPDVVLCDLHLPGISGLEVTERVVRGGYGTRMIIVSVLEDGPLPKRLLEAGASRLRRQGRRGWPSCCGRCATWRVASVIWPAASRSTSRWRGSTATARRSTN